MLLVKEQMTKIIQEQPDDCSYSCTWGEEYIKWKK